MAQSNQTQAKQPQLQLPVNIKESLKNVAINIANSLFYSAFQSKHTSFQLTFQAVQNHLDSLQIQTEDPEDFESLLSSIRLVEINYQMDGEDTFVPLFSRAMIDQENKKIGLMLNTEAAKHLVPQNDQLNKKPSYLN